MFCYITLVLVCCVCFLTFAGKTIIVYTASLFAQERKDLTTFASSAITTVLCSVDQTLNYVNGLAEFCCFSLPCIKMLTMCTLNNAQVLIRHRYVARNVEKIASHVFTLSRLPSAIHDSKRLIPKLKPEGILLMSYA